MLLFFSTSPEAPIKASTYNIFFLLSIIGASGSRVHYDIATRHGIINHSMRPTQEIHQTYE